VILAQGTADIVASGQTPRYLLAVPGATFQALLGAGHAPQSDAPDNILELLRQVTRRADVVRTG
jgi:pimeloyl-ACP methyl ester carboxylesterase